MASRSRRLPLLAIAAFAFAVLAAGCQTVPQKPFHYSAAQGKVPVEDSAVVVAIGEDCHADKERVVLDTAATGERDSHDQVIWVVEGEQPGDRIVISAKPANEQVPGDPAKGRKIRDLFGEQYEIRSLDETPPNNAIRSGKPKKSLLILKQHSATWKYSVEYFRAGKRLCIHDPDICVQKPGSNGCSG